MIALSEPFDLDDALTITRVRSGGGFLQDGEESTSQVFIEVTAVPIGTDGPPVTFRLCVGLDLYFVMMAGLEHAGKTAIMMPN